MKWKLILLMGLWMVIMMVSVLGATPEEANITTLHNKAVLKMHFYNATYDNSTNKAIGSFNTGLNEGINAQFFNTTTCLNKSSGCIFKGTDGIQHNRIIMPIKGTADGILNQTTGSNNITISFWANFTSIIQSNFVFEGCDGECMSINIDGSGNLDVRIPSKNDMKKMYSVTAKVAYGAWTHYVFVLNATEGANGAIHAFVNGTWNGSSTASSGGNPISALTFSIAGSTRSSSAFAGLIQGLYIFNGTLNESEILYLNKTVILQDPEPVPVITNETPRIIINTPSNNSKTHNATPFINFTINTTSPNNNITWEFYMDKNNLPTTKINRSENRTQGNFTFSIYTLNNVTEGSLNGTYRIMFNITDNASNNVILFHTFDLTNDINLYNVTNVSITPLPLEANTQAKCHYNLTNKISLTSTPNQSDNISITDLRWWINNSIVSTANNNTLLNAPNVTLNSNITCEVRINNGFGETAWTPYVNSSTVTIGDTTLPSITNQSIKSSSLITTDILNITAKCTDTNTINYVRAEINSSNKTMILLGDDLFSFSGEAGTLFTVGLHNITKFYCADGSGNIANDTSNITFTVSNAPSGGSSSSPVSGGGGGGGGCKPGFTKDEKTGECVNITRLIRFTKNLTIIPQSNIDTFFIFTSFKESIIEWRYLLKANKVLKNCTIQGNFECKIFQQSDILLISKQKNTDFFSKIEKGSVKVIDNDDQVSFRIVVVRMINLTYPLPFLPFKGSLIVSSIGLVIITTIYRKQIGLALKRIRTKSL